VARMFLGDFYSNLEPGYLPTTARAERLKAALGAAGIAAEVVLDGNVDWDGQSFPNGLRVFVEVGDADLGRAQVVMEATE
jgi:hypothetical protein